MSWNKRKTTGQDKKFGNLRCTCNLGHSHRSQLERTVCLHIQARQQSGELELVQVEDHIYLSKARILYIPDFKCLDLKSGEFFWIEAKGKANDRWPMKKRLWKHYGPGRLEIWQGTHNRPLLAQILIPELTEGNT